MCIRDRVQAAPAVLDALHNAQALFVMAVERGRLGRGRVDALVAGKAARQRLLSRVAERGVAQVMAEGDGLRQILVQTERPGNGAGDLGDLQRVREPCAEVVAFRRQEHLRLVRQAAEQMCIRDRA